MDANQFQIKYCTYFLKKLKADYKIYVQMIRSRVSKTILKNNKTGEFLLPISVVTLRL